MHRLRGSYLDMSKAHNVSWEGNASLMCPWKFPIEKKVLGAGGGRGEGLVGFGALVDLLCLWHQPSQPLDTSRKPLDFPMPVSTVQQTLSLQGPDSKWFRLCVPRDRTPPMSQPLNSAIGVCKQSVTMWTWPVAYTLWTLVYRTG